MLPRSKVLILALLCLAAILAVGAALVWRHPAAAPTLAIGTYVTPRQALEDFSLIDQRGHAFGPKNLRDHWSMLFFGYANCPEFCPATLTTLAAMKKRLRASGAAVLPQVIFVSVDPNRDTPELLAKYVPYFDPEFIGVTAPDQPTIDAVARQFGVAVIIEPKQADGSYAVDHSSAIWVLDPSGKLAAVLTGPFTVEALQADFQRIVTGPA
jgi:protein SCO1/2